MTEPTTPKPPTDRGDWENTLRGFLAQQVSDEARLSARDAVIRRVSAAQRRVKHRRFA